LTQPAAKWHEASADEGRGLVQVFTGDGKGKTTAALGAVIRALGQGKRVFIIFFMKGDYPYGEREVLRRLPGVNFASFGTLDFVTLGQLSQQDREEASRALAAAREAVLGGSYDLVVLDEICLAAAFGLIPEDEVKSLIREKPAALDLILTGRRADPETIKLADLVTECVKIKHHFDKGVPSRKGIEY